MVRGREGSQSKILRSVRSVRIRRAAKQQRYKKIVSHAGQIIKISSHKTEYMHAARTALFTGMIQLFLLPASFGQSADSTVLVVHKTRDFACSGDTSAAGWQGSSWLVLPKRNQNGVYYQTRMKLLYSDSGIYCLYYC